MRKILLIISTLTLFLLSSVSVFAEDSETVVEETMYSMATTYIQIDSDTRVFFQYGSEPKNCSIYLRDNGDSLTFMFRYGTANAIYIANSDGTGSTLRNNGLYTTNMYGGTVRCYDVPYPFTIDGKTFNNGTDFSISCTGVGVYRIDVNASGSSVFSEPQSFFRNPLKEVVETNQRGTAEAMKKMMDSYLHFLVPCGIGCLVLLLVLTIFFKVFWIFRIR